MSIEKNIQEMLIRLNRIQRDLALLIQLATNTPENVEELQFDVGKELKKYSKSKGRGK